MSKRFSNMDNVKTTKSFKELMAWRKERAAKEKDLSYVVPHEGQIEADYLLKNRSETTVTWVGHATFLIQTGGMNILTDPVWASHMALSPRLSEPGLMIEQLPPIDLVLISHGHYDHLDIPTLKKLKSDPVYFVPRGLGRTLKRNGFGRVIEMNWWDKQLIDGLSVHFVPAQHWVRRTLLDTNRSHWGGFVIEKPGEKAIYFAGDSGYFRGFQEIGKRFDLGPVLMPIGAYEPEWFMSAQHMTPEEAVRAFHDTKGTLMIPMHYGAYRLADDTPKEAIDRLEGALEQDPKAKQETYIAKLGEVIRLNENSQIN